jgi:hypothetical protein
VAQPAREFHAPGTIIVTSSDVVFVTVTTAPRGTGPGKSHIPPEELPPGWGDCPVPDEGDAGGQDANYSPSTRSNGPNTTVSCSFAFPLVLTGGDSIRLTQATRGKGVKPLA